MFSSRFRIALITVFVSACGGSSPPATKTAARTVKEDHHEPTWSRVSWEDRHETMTFTVLPNMGRAWQKFAQSDAPTLTCRTCHGQDAEAVKYKMPNPNLLPLDPAHLPSETSSDPREARYATFMNDEVVPRMTFLLDAEAHDAKTGAGFGCFNCHTKKNP